MREDVLYMTFFILFIKLLVLDNTFNNFYVALRSAPCVTLDYISSIIYIIHNATSAALCALLNQLHNVMVREGR